MIQLTGRLRLLIFFLSILFVWVGFDGYSQTLQSNESLEEVTPQQKSVAQVQYETQALQKLILPHRPYRSDIQ